LGSVNGKYADGLVDIEREAILDWYQAIVADPGIGGRKQTLQKVRQFICEPLMTGFRPTLLRDKLFEMEGDSSLQC